MLAALSAVVALACSLASAWRLWLVIDLTSVDLQVLLDALAGARDPARCSVTLRREIAARGLPWASALFAAFEADSEAQREASLSEELMELDWRTQRWSRVPRICASIATSAGLLFASLAILRELGGPADASPGAVRTAALTDAMSALSVGIAGTSFCVAVLQRARRIVREQLVATERLVARLRTLAADRTQ